MNSHKNIVENLLQPSGITINGNKPYDIRIHNDKFYPTVISQGSIGLGETYMKGWWDCDALDQFFFKLFKARLEEKVKSDLILGFKIIKAKLFNHQTKTRSVKSIASHYDIGNDLYELMLDKYMMYSCGYWEDATTLNQAQENKLELICRKLKLIPGHRVLEIGCGWGGFAQYAAEKYQVKVVGVTISVEQAKLARERCKDLDVEIRIQDYRELNEKFDRIVSIGMFEHVGFKNYSTYMEVVERNLKEDGISLLHTIGCNESSSYTDPWINKYIFPDSHIPSIAQIAHSMEGKFVMQDWHNLDIHYDHTLMEWNKKFRRGWARIKHNYSDEFYRMWIYYLTSCAASFRARKNNLWQVVFTTQSYPEEYKSVRSLENISRHEINFLRNLQMSES